MFRHRQERCTADQLCTSFHRELLSGTQVITQIVDTVDPKSSLNDLSIDTSFPPNESITPADRIVIETELSSGSVSSGPRGIRASVLDRLHVGTWSSIDPVSD